MKKLILLSAIALSTISGYGQPGGSTTQPPSSAQTPPSTPPTAPAVPPSSAPQPPSTTTPPSSAQTPPSTPPVSVVPPSSAPQPPSTTQAPSAAQQPQSGAQSSSAPVSPSSTQQAQSAPQAPVEPAAAPAKPSAPAATPAAPASASAAGTENAWKFGLHATPSIKWLSTTTDGLKTDGAKVGFSYGLVAEYFFQSRYSFCSGIDFAYRGGKLKSTGTDDLKFETTLQYLEIPITIKMHTNEKDKKLFYAKFGVSPGWNIGRSGDNLSPVGGTDPDELNGFYMALKIGGGMEYEISDQTMLFGGLVWNNGFTDAFKSNSFDAKNKSVELEIGILF